MRNMRLKFILASLVAGAGLIGWGRFWTGAWWFFLFLGPVILIGIYDLFQRSHSISRNFPFIGHFRYLAEVFAPEIHQYFVESDTDGTPFNRIQRGFVYKRAKRALQTHPFGTELNIYSEGYEWLPHSIFPAQPWPEPPRVSIGGPRCTQPYSASLLNISAMSFGALSNNAIRALNAAARQGGFYHNTGEGGLSKYHLESGGDIVLQIGTAYFGCRTVEGNFAPDKFREKAALPQVRMIELKLSQGAKPGHGGVLPAVKNTGEIAAIRGVEPHTTVLSPPGHTAFNSPEGLVKFLAQLRALSGGKPVGFKLCVGSRSEFEAICKAMQTTGMQPDFITVDGGEGGTGAAPIEFSNYVGMPLEEGLVLVVDTLRKYGLKQNIRVIASGKVITGFDIFRNLALGADLCNSARGMLFALGCIQSLRCDSNECPTGITTHKPGLVRGLVVSDKAERVYNFHLETVKATVELLTAAGISDLSQINRSHIYKKVSPYQMLSFADIYPEIPQ